MHVCVCVCRSQDRLYDWFLDWKGLQPYLEPYLTQKTRILNVGSGTSRKLMPG